MTTERARDVLRRCPLFADLPEERLAALGSAAVLVELAAGETLIEAGQAPTALFVVAGGRFRVVDSVGRPVAEIDIGETVGEIALIDEGAASAKVIATRDARVLKLPAAVVRDLLSAEPDLAMRFAATVAGRLRERNARRGLRSPKVIAVTGGQAGARLRRAMLDVLPAAREAVRTEDVWALEGDHVVLVAGDELRSGADLEIVVRSGTGEVLPPCAPRRIEAAVSAGAPPGLAPGSDFRVAVDPADRSAVERLVRIAVGGARVLVLAGGGWRAAPNLGVMAEFEAAGVEHDLIVGVSASSPMAVLLAKGYRADRITDEIYRFGSRINVMRDLGPTRWSVTTGRTLTAAAKGAVGAIRLDDLPRPCVLAATSLTSGATVALTEGPAWRAVRASCSIPVIFPPYPLDGELLVDGGVVENVPTSLAYRLLPDPVVTAVTVGRAPEFELASFSSSGVARRSLSPRRRGQLVDLMEACLRRNPGPIRCDHLLESNNDEAGMFSRRRFDRGVALGRTTARAHLASLPDDGRL